MAVDWAALVDKQLGNIKPTKEQEVAAASKVAEENISSVTNNKIKEESLSALEVLGIPKRTSEKIADRILKQNPELSVEELVKQILKNI